MREDVESSGGTNAREVGHVTLRALVQPEVFFYGPDIKDF